ncbi:MAG TPA: glutamyl-tRNA reductase [Xanthomonadales bacterium]|nr:glutamyl-tRNA reductase [Xanthomonadales bacterium]
MTLIALGLNHQTAPVALRERVAFDADGIVAALRDLAGQPGVAECAILSTCNRTELYCDVAPGAEAVPAAWLARHHGFDDGRLDEFLVTHREDAAVRHLFRVATGLDSLILGEPQILGQVKEAYHHARTAGTLHAPLERLFQSAFGVAKRARTDTRIGANPVSVAFAAVRLAQHVFAELERSTVLLVGAGDTIELVARHLRQLGATELRVANRTLANATSLSERFGAQAVPLAELPRQLVDADVVITSTASRTPLITREMVAAAQRERRHRPLLLVDLAVPRDVEPRVAELDDVFLYTIDDLGSVIEESLRSRREAALEAEAIIDLQVEGYVAWSRALRGHGPLRALRAAGERERDAVLGRARAMLASGRSPEETLEFLAQTLTNKLLHAPSANLRAAALRGDSELLRAAERLYQDATAAPGAPDKAP